MTSHKLHRVAAALVMIGGVARHASAQAPATDQGQGQGQVSCPPANATEPSTACPAAQPPAAQPTLAPEVEAPWYETFGFAVSIGGGVDDFVKNTMRDISSVGGSWNLRVIGGTHSYIGFEASYIGSAQSLNNLSGISRATLYGNGVQLTLRLNATTGYPIQPFIYSGGAYRRYGMTSTGINLDNFESNNNVAEVPLGVGVAAYLGEQPGLMLDVRGEYRFAWGDEMLQGTSGSNNNTLDRWGVTGNIGYAF
jgi:hypothetical protein